MASLSRFCELMREACEDWDLGYDQSQRWNVYDGGECDCSSLVITKLGEAGFDTGGSTYTGNMSDELTARGWKRLPFDIDKVRAGDILLNDERHVCAVISGSGRNAIIAQASIDEYGRASGGAAGDQTGGETNTKQVYVYWAGWDCILRWGGESDAEDEKLDVDGKVGPKTVREWQRQCGTYVDGVISGQSERYKNCFPAFNSVTFEADGSQLMKKVQQVVGVPHPTGVIGSGTVAYIQGWLMLRGYTCNGDRAGVFGEYTAKALQQSLNDGEWTNAL